MGKPGQQKTVPMHAGQARYRIWRSIRMMRRFTLADLGATADASRANVCKYVRALLAANYLRVVKEAVPAHRVEGYAIYALVNDSGPLPPRCRKDGTIFDLNLEKSR
jgi:hypothetical protein